MKGRILLSHGAGGKETGELLNALILSRIWENLKRVEGGYGIDVLDDGATIPLGDGKHMVLSIDSFTVNPIFFPGGDIGKLAATGSINDVAVMGAKPIALMDSIVAEEGFPMEDLEKIVMSMITVAEEESIAIIGGDFKVMPKDQIDKIVISTVAVGIASKPIIDKHIKPGDKIIISGTVGEHGAAIMALQQGLSIETGELRSDCQPLTKLMLPLVEKYPDDIHAAQDPTRGGVTQVLNEWAQKTGNIIVVEEEKIPVREPVRAYSEMLGVDPLSLACEGRVLLGVEREVAEEVLNYIRNLGYVDAEIIGEVYEPKKHRGLVLEKTIAGGIKVLESPSGEVVPRIC